MSISRTRQRISTSPGRDVRAGTVAGIYARWIGSVGGLDVVETAVKWTITPDLTPAWDIGMAYEIEVRGHPNVTLRAGVLPEFGSMTMDEMIGIGSVITAMPVVNAIPAVVAARPGIVGYSDLPAVAARLVPAPPPRRRAEVPLTLACAFHARVDPAGSRSLTGGAVAQP